MPVMKAKPGEFDAWRKVDAAAIAAGARPLFEVVPTAGPDKDLQDVVARASKDWPGGPLLLDTGYLNQTQQVAASGRRVIEWCADVLPMEYRPVVRPGDPVEVLSDVALAHAKHNSGACLRFGSNDADPDVPEADALLKAVLAETGLQLSELDLVIDLWAIADGRTVTRCVPIVNALLAWAASRGTWRSVTVLSGAFPNSISDFDRDTYTPVHRFDADLWVAVGAANAALVPDFGDYVVNHPALPGAGRGPLPNLRYTNGADWWVWRESKTLPGNESFFALCERVVASPAWTGATFSWGDTEVERCSTYAGGPGTATQWRAFATSHHIATVTGRLSTTGAP